MRLVSVVILNKQFDVRQVGAKNSNIYTFSAMETDLDGARIPCEIQTFKDDVKDFLLKRADSTTNLLIPFNSLSNYGNKNQYTVDPVLLNSNFDASNHFI